MKREIANDNVWESFKKGDWDAYAKLYDGYYSALNNYGYKFTRDVSLIEDSIHDLFVKLWNNKANLGDPASVKNYLYKSLRGILFRKIKSHSKFVIMQDDDDYSFDFEASHDNQLILQEDEQHLQQVIKKALSELPARQQEIVYLRFYEGLSYEEISEIMAINISSVYKLWYKVHDNLQQSLKTTGYCVVMISFGKIVCVFLGPETR